MIRDDEPDYNIDCQFLVPPVFHPSVGFMSLAVDKCCVRWYIHAFYLLIASFVECFQIPCRPHLDVASSLNSSMGLMLLHCL